MLCPSGSDLIQLDFGALAVGSFQFFSDTLNYHMILVKDIIIKYPENKIDKLYEYLNSILRKKMKWEEICKTYNYLSKIQNNN